MRSVVVDRGQVTIPKKLRDRLGIVPRTVLDFHEENGKIIVVKAPEKDGVASVLGCLKIDKGTDAINS
ncbi:AbrB/MazE/SpoVT family DNA-binding domain-containing protein [bacterium]|nr:AbrB/MazE/SpoVT family DNA-binding domain-containing protein [bacterium]